MAQGEIQRKRQGGAHPPREAVGVGGEQHTHGKDLLCDAPDISASLGSVEMKGEKEGDFLSSITAPRPVSSILGRAPLRTLPLGTGKDPRGSSHSVAPFGRWKKPNVVWLSGHHIAALWKRWSPGVWAPGQGSLPQPRGLKILSFRKVPSLVTIKKSIDFGVKLAYSSSAYTSHGTWGTSTHYSVPQFPHVT